MIGHGEGLGEVTLVGFVSKVRSRLERVHQQARDS